ncbi:hypothetical protein VTJ04DRAFT_7299 [Mycothermus thermophilus]|uniref:uncharacterized protein n=1 Tax=Humicola insolens TaxID=85995 RepID=UPI0037447AF0
MSYYQNPQQLPNFYGDLSRAGAGGIPMASYDPYAVSAVQSLQIPTTSATMGGPVGGSLPTQHRASSGAWNAQDDSMLLQLRAMGKNWNQIQREAFPGKTGNACRKRHERLMERRGQNDFDTRKLERLCKEYMNMRKEIWQGLAAKCGEKWNVVEAQCMSNGLKNIQSHARAYARRERLEAGLGSSSSNASAYDDPNDADGMCLTPTDEHVDLDIDADGADQSYSSPETTGSSSTGSGGPHSTPAGAAAASSQHHHHLLRDSLRSSHPSHSHSHHPSYSTSSSTTFNHHHQHSNSLNSLSSGGGSGGHHGSHHHHSQSYSGPYHGYGTGGGYGHSYSNSVSSTASAPEHGNRANPTTTTTSPAVGGGNYGRLPSIGDIGSMGIDAIIHRGGPN